MPSVIIESRLDSAFFSEEIIDKLNENNIEFTASVPFARFIELKNIIENRKRWRQLDDDISFFEIAWKPKSWSTDYRFIFIRKS